MTLPVGERENSNMNKRKGTVTPEGAARMLGVSRWHVYRMIKAGALTTTGDMVNLTQVSGRDHGIISLLTKSAGYWR